MVQEGGPWEHVTEVFYNIPEKRGSLDFYSGRADFEVDDIRLSTPKQVITECERNPNTLHAFYTDGYAIKVGKILYVEES